MSVRWLKGKMLLFGLVVGYQGLMLIVYMLRYFLLHEGLWLSKKNLKELFEHFVVVPTIYCLGS